MYCKLFASLYQGTLRGKSKEILVFTNLLAHCDAEGVVDKHFKAIAEETGLSVEEVKEALISLQSPDPESRSPEFDGRRIQLLDEHRAWGWQVVNYGKYRAIRNAEDRKEQNRKSQQAYRERQRSAVPLTVSKVSKVSQGKPQSAYVEVEGDEEVKNTNCESASKIVPKAGKPAKERVRNEFFDILAGAGNQNPEAMTESEGGRVAKALSDIRKACPDLTTDELKRRIQNYRLHFPDVILTPTAISANWSRLENAPVAKPSASRDPNPSRKNENLQSKVITLNP